MKNSLKLNSRIFKSKVNVVILIGLFFLLIPNSKPNAQTLPLGELVHADDMYFSREGDLETIRIVGHVIIRKGIKEIRCDEVTIYQKQDLTILKGNVEFQDSSRYLSADLIKYYSNPEKEIAQGNVHLIIDQKDIVAGELQYFKEDEFVEATKDVHFQDFEENVELFGGKITYDRNKELGHAEIKPKLVKRDSLGNIDLTITAVELNYNGQENQANAQDSVVIVQKDATIYAQQAYYNEAEDRIDLTGNPKVLKKRDQLTADKIELFFEENSLRKAHLIENSEMFSELLIEGKPASDKLKGKEMWVDIINDSLKHIKVFEQAVSTYHIIEDDEIQGVNQVMGDELEVVFEDGKVRYVTIRSKPGLSRGQFTPAGRTVRELKWAK
jgi:lipopolysaccharide assembly outer membrane protein LptD (OstA)